ncbi:MAG: rhodanese-like domain-containing protein [Candidatus Moraniibacteriota bacterium]
METPPQSSSSEQKVIFFGALLIVVVIGFSFFRWYRTQHSAPPAVPTDQSAAASPNKIRRPIALGVAELQQRLNQPGNDKKTTIIDTRTAKDFQAQHIIDSLNVTSETLNSALPSTRPDDFLAVLIGDGSTESIANLQAVAQKAQDDGIAVTVLQGGFTAWTKAFGRTISAGDTTSLVDASKVTIVSPDQAKALLDTSGGSFAVLDTRFPESFQAGHIPGAINIPLEQLEAKHAEIPLGKRIILYNDAPVPAFQSAVRVFDLGFAGAASIEGGLAAWQAKGYPVEK